MNTKQANAQKIVSMIDLEELEKVSSEIDLDKLVLTIWKDGTSKAWGTMDAFYARSDPDWLMDISVAEIIRMHERETLQANGYLPQADLGGEKS